MARLLINSKSLLTPLTGIGRYTYEIVTRLPREAGFDYSYYYYGKVTDKIITSSGSGENKSLLPMIRNILVKNQFTKGLIRGMLDIRSRLFSDTYDLYWEPAIIPVKGIKAKKTVVTVHDMSLHLHPEWHLKESVSYFNKNFWDNIKNADYIITDTETVKAEVAEITGFDPERIKAIHLGINDGVFKEYPQDAQDAYRSESGLDYKFILYVGSIEPRKNLSRMIQAYSSLSDSVKAEYKLLLVGYKGWGNDEIHQLIEKDKENIKYLGYVTDEELALVYNLAELFVYPTLYEGFGLPPLEAMACGAPVLTSTTPCVQEVCADAAEYANPFSIDDTREKILTLLQVDNARNALAQKGLAHSAGFRWDKTAGAHYDIFKSL